MLDNLEVIPMIDNKLVSLGEMVGDALPVISLKNLAEDSDPDRVVKRNSYRNLHRPNITHLDWVSNSSGSKEEVLPTGVYRQTFFEANELCSFADSDGQ